MKKGESRTIRIETTERREGPPAKKKRRRAEETLKGEEWEKEYTRDLIPSDWRKQSEKKPYFRTSPERKKIRNFGGIR